MTMILFISFRDKHTLDKRIREGPKKTPTFYGHVRKRRWSTPVRKFFFFRCCFIRDAEYSKRKKTFFFLTPPLPYPLKKHLLFMKCP